MSATTSAHLQAATHRASTPTLLGIPAELRNIIYDNVFSSETKQCLAPHALTRVSKSIRRDSLAMYYGPVKSKPLEIPLHNPLQFTHAKQWLAELPADRYTILPDIEFSWTEHNNFGSYKFSLRCARWAITPDRRFSIQIGWRNKTGVPSSRIVE